MVIKTSTNYTLKYDSSWSQLQLNEIYVWCDTTANPITITLPKISSMGGNLNTKFYIVDTVGTASTNNITVVSAVGNEIVGGSAVVTETYGSVVITAVDRTKWLVLSNGGGGGGIKDYKQAQLPNVSINPQSEKRGDLFGKAKELGVEFFGTTPFVTLSNGHIAEISYCQSLLPNGILIYEAYDYQDLSENSGWWVAFKQSSTNSKLLEKVADLKMTSQFWDKWYDWTLKNEGDNTVKYITCNFPSAGNVIQSWITKLTYNNGVLTAQDSTVTFGGITFLQLYNQLAGTLLEEDAVFNSRSPEYILDDDYYGMANGKEVGWFYYRCTSVPNTSGEIWNTVGFNILTGQTRYITPVANIYGTVTNFNFMGTVAFDLIVDWVNHPNGIAYSFCNQMPLDNGDNVNGVTCLWSPYFANPNTVLYINTRDMSYGNFVFIKGQLGGEGFYSYYWDNKNWFTYKSNTEDIFNRGSSILVQRFNTDTKAVKTWIVPIFVIDFFNSSANNEGILLPIGGVSKGEFIIGGAFGQYVYYYFTNSKEYWALQSNNLYPTNLLGDNSYSCWSTLLYNPYSVGIEVDTHIGVNFSDN